MARTIRILKVIGSMVVLQLESRSASLRQQATGKAFLLRNVLMGLPPASRAYGW
jgi:hypothetical protein